MAYEARRLFRDKIVGAKELHLFDSILTSVFQGDWGSDVLDNMAGNTVRGDAACECSRAGNLLFWVIA